MLWGVITCGLQQSVVWLLISQSPTQARHIDDYLRVSGVFHAEVVNAWIGHHGIYKSGVAGIQIAIERMYNIKIKGRIRYIEYLQFIQYLVKIIIALVWLAKLCFRSVDML